MLLLLQVTERVLDEFERQESTPVIGMMEIRPLAGPLFRQRAASQSAVDELSSFLRQLALDDEDDTAGILERDELRGACFCGANI